MLLLLSLRLLLLPLLLVNFFIQIFHSILNSLHVSAIFFQGYCPWSIYTYNGLLLPSNPNNGVLLYNNAYYAFSTLKGAYEFSADPEVITKGVADVTRKSPELIQLLELHKQFAAITPYSQVSRFITGVSQKCNSWRYQTWPCGVWRQELCNGKWREVTFQC